MRGGGDGGFFSPLSPDKHAGNPPPESSMHCVLKGTHSRGGSLGAGTQQPHGQTCLSHCGFSHPVLN